MYARVTFLILCFLYINFSSLNVPIIPVSLFLIFLIGVVAALVELIVRINVLFMNLQKE